MKSWQFRKVKAAPSPSKPDDKTEPPKQQLTQDLTHGDLVIDEVLNEIKIHLEKCEVKGTAKAVARQIVAFLTTTFELSANVVIKDFVANNEAETSKARSQLAISMQRAAALFALQENLLKATHEQLEKHIQIAKNFKSGYVEWYHEQEFVQPLQHQAREVKTKLQQAHGQQVHAQAMFQKLREQATRPIMQQLQVSNKEYTHLFKREDPEPLRLAVNAIAPSTQQGEVRQDLACRFESSSIEYLQALYHEATRARDELHKVLSIIQTTCQRSGVVVEIEMGGLKAVERSMEKTVEEYGGDFSRLLDLARGSVVCKNMNCAIAVVRSIRDMKLQIVRIKNRLDRYFSASAESGGYRDILLNLRVNGGHVCELQIQLEPFLQLKTGGGHKIYGLARGLHLLDAELSQVRMNSMNTNERISEADCISYNGLKVRRGLDVALQRVENGTCQGLHLNQFKLATDEWKALTLALNSSACNVRDISLPNCGLERETNTTLYDDARTPLGDFCVVRLSENKKISGKCVSLFISEELEDLNLQNCQIETDEWIVIGQAMLARNPFRMRSLNLQVNCLRQEGARNLAPALQMMTNVTNLDLYKTQLGPQGAKHLGTALIVMTNMTSLNLHDNALGPEGAMHLVPALTKMTNMTSLCLGDNELGPEGAKHLVPALTQMPKMARLFLWYNGLGPEGASLLAPALASMTSLIALDLNRNGLESEGAKHLASALIMMTNMTGLVLRDNDFGPEGAKYLAPALTMMTKLTNLNIITTQIGPEGAKHLAPALAAMTKLGGLHIERNGLGPEGAKHLAPALIKLMSLNNLSLRGNDLGPEGIKHLAPALTTMTNLPTLNLRDSALGPEGAKYLAPALTMMTNMTNLNLEGNELGPEGAKHLAPALITMTNMATLILSRNELGSEGAMQLAPALTMMTNITNLNLSDNDMSSANMGGLQCTVALNKIRIAQQSSAQELCLSGLCLGPEEAMLINSQLLNLSDLMQLDLSGNMLGPEGAKHLTPALTMMENLTSLNLSDNKLGSEGTQHLTLALTMMTNLITLNLDGNEKISVDHIDN